MKNSDVRYIDPTTGKQIASNDPRTIVTAEDRVAAAKAAQAAFEARFKK